jgi:hypothetical protein
VSRRRQEPLGRRFGANALEVIDNVPRGVDIQTVYLTELNGDGEVASGIVLQRIARR